MSILSKLLKISMETEGDKYFYTQSVCVCVCDIEKNHMNSAVVISQVPG